MVTVPANMSCHAAYHLMLEKGVHHLVIDDQFHTPELPDEVLEDEIVAWLTRRAAASRRSVKDQAIAWRFA